MKYAARLLKRSFEDSKKKTKTRKEIVLNVVKESPSKDLCTVRETEVRDLIAAVDGMPDSAVVLNPTPMKQTEEKQLQTARRTIAKATLPILCFPQADVVAAVEIEEIETATRIDPIAIAAKVPHHRVMIEIDEIARGMMREIDFTEEEVTLEEALMSFLMVMISPAETDDEGLTVILKVRAAEETPRFVVHVNI